MKQIEDAINKWIKEKGEITTHTIAFIIMDVAHGYDKRENEETYYIMHPRRVAKTLDDYIYTNQDRYGKDGYLYEQFLEMCEIPYKGLLEIGFLHDVVEDTELTHEDIRYFFEITGNLEFFNNYIDEPLRLITHNKTEDYDTYIGKVLIDSTAALVKLADLNDNLNIFDLKEFTEKEMERSIRYLHYIKVIEDKYHFLEKVKRYRTAVDDWQDTWG